MESVGNADCSKELTRDAATEDGNLAESLRDGIQQFAVSHSVYKELSLGSYINMPLLSVALQTTPLYVIVITYLLIDVGFIVISCYRCHCLVSEGIVMLGIMLCACVWWDL